MRIWYRSTARDSNWANFEDTALPFLGDMYRVAIWLVRNKVDAEDLVQETFMQALQSFHRFEPGTNCRAWLVTIMYRLRSRKMRNEGRLRLVDFTEEQLAETIPYDPPIPEALTDKEIMAALESLPVQYQEVLVLSDVEEFSYKEIATALTLPLGTVMSRLHRARRLLRIQLVDYAQTNGFASTDEQTLEKSTTVKIRRKSDAMP